MHKYAVAHSLLMIFMLASFSSGSAIIQPFRIVRRQTHTVQQPSQTQSSPAIVQPAPTVSKPTASDTTSTPQSDLPTPTVPSIPIDPTQISSNSSSISVSSPISETAISLTTSTPSATPLTSTSTGPQGQVTVVTTIQPTDTTSASPTPTGSSGASDSSNKTGTIIGLSVAGGVTALAIIAFIIWKLTRKRFSDLDDPDLAIKWPELNQETNVGSGLARKLSNTALSNIPSRNVSQSEFGDSYAVPPLPQHNPNIPYRDDPASYNTSGSGYYDPYRGPVPQTLHGGPIDEAESIPMSTYPSSSRSRSPGPGPSYDMGGRGSPAPGRASPTPGVLYDVGARRSPAPGRTLSPGPAAALGLDRRPSPGLSTHLG